MTVSWLYDDTDTVPFQVIFRQCQVFNVLTHLFFSVITLETFIEFITLILSVFFLFSVFIFFILSVIQAPPLYSFLEFITLILCVMLFSVPSSFSSFQ